jgi:peptidoglycan/LPS O-acetylase OafA/YrhL
VLAYHLCIVFGRMDGGPAAPLLAELKGGVAIFFVISGYVLYLPCAQAIAGRGHLPGWRSFAERRLRRIVPGYWAVLTVSALAIPSVHVFGPGQWRYYLFAQIYDPDTVLGGLGVAWSLCVEVSFYLLLPLLALGLRGLAGGCGARTQASRQLLALAAVATGSLSLRWWLAGSGVASIPHSGFVLATALPGFLDWFALGMALAVLAVARPGVTRWRRPATCWAVATALVLATAGLQPDDLFLPLYGPAAHLTVGLAAAFVVLPFTVEMDARPGARLTRVLAGRCMVWLGTVSYGVYLWQLPVLVALLGHPADLGMPTAVPIQALALIVAATTGTIACATASWYLLERPLMRLRGRAPHPRPAAARA